MFDILDIAVSRKAIAKRNAAAIVESRRAALGYVLDASAELLAAASAAGIGDDRQFAAVRAIRKAASRALEAAEASK